MATELLGTQLARYSSHHRHPANRLLHYVGVPAITLSLLIAASHLELFTTGSTIVTLAWVLAAAVFVYWLILDPAIGAVAIALHLPLVWLAAILSRVDANPWAVLLTIFLGGWVFQLIGHRIEGRRPALLDNLAQIFIAPFFLVAEVLFAMGVRGSVHRTVEERWRDYLPSRKSSGL